MNTLLSQVESLRSSLDELRTYHELERQAKTIHERHKSLLKQVDAARSPVGFLRALESRDFEVPASEAPEDLKSLGRQVTALRSALAEGPAALLDGDAIVLLVAGAKSAASDFRNRAKRAWGLYQEQAGIPDTDETLLKSHEGVETLKSLIAEIRQCRKALQDRRGEDWLTPEALDDFDKTVARLKVAHSQFMAGLEDLPQAVKEFFVAVAKPGGAPLKSLTPEVLAWLEDKELDSKYRINPSGSRR